MPDIFASLHAAGLVTGPAVIVVLLASVAGSADIITSAVLVLIFVVITSRCRATRSLRRRVASRSPRRPRTLRAEAIG